MKRSTLSWLAMALLAFNAAGAIPGGLSLILHPDGSALDLSMELLAHSGFATYLIPGWILLLFNGIFSIITLVLTMRQSNHFGWFISVQGAVLTGWIVIQVILLQFVWFLHVVMGIVGLALGLTGWLINRRTNVANI